MFAPVNCAGLPETLLESELFGHVKGSFTGAYRDKPGKLETAHMGTVFLDEVGEMTLRMQGLLLRFLETGELQKVGADGSGRHRQRARHRRDQPQPARHDRAGHVPRGPVLPPERHPHRRAAAARAPRGHSAARRAVPVAVRVGEPIADHRRSSPARDEGAHRVLVAGQRPRARERHRAAGRDRAGRDDRARPPARPRSACRQRRAPPEARAPAHGGRRSLQAA